MGPCSRFSSSPSPSASPASGSTSVTATSTSSGSGEEKWAEGCGTGRAAMAVVGRGKQAVSRTAMAKQRSASRAELMSFFRVKERSD